MSLRTLGESGSLLLFSNNAVLIDSHILKGNFFLRGLFVHFLSNTLSSGYAKKKISK